MLHNSHYTYVFLSGASVVIEMMWCAAEKVAVMKEHEQQKLLAEEPATKLEPIVEENGKSIEKSSSGQALLVTETEQPSKRRVTIVDYYTNGSGDLSSTVGMKLFSNCMKPKFYGSSFLIASSLTHPCEDARRMSGDFPVQLATRLPDWSAGGLLKCTAVHLFMCCVIVQTQRARHVRLVDKSLASSSDMPDFLVTC